jgi:hypothetical protein
MTTENEKYLQGELSSLAIECRRKKEFNDNEGLEVLATATKRTSLLGLQTHFPLDLLFTCLFAHKSCPYRKLKSIYSHY